MMNSFTPSPFMPNQSPYDYNPMANDPSMMQPSYPQFPSYSGLSSLLPQYAEGGRVHPQGLGQMAEMIRRQGEEGDKILAHINPQEATELAENYGYDINPMTGLPQFGGIGRGLKKMVRHPKKMLKRAIPVVTTIIGHTLGGPIGAVIGAGTGKAIAGGSWRNAPKNFIKGAGTVAALNFAAPFIGRGLSSMGMGQLGNSIGKMGWNPLGINTSGGGGGGLSSLVRGSGGGGSGLSSLVGGSGGASGLVQSAGGNAASQATQGKGGLLGKLFGNMGLDDALLATAVLGTLKRREKTPQEASFDSMVNQAGPNWRSDQQPRQLQPYQRTQRPINNLDLTQGYPDYYEQVNPWGLKAGGHLEGYTGGQDDKIPAMLSDGEYVIDATTVSQLGDGNNRAGAQKLKQMVENVRRHKGFKGLPPKAKSIESYMRAR
jgi:hypothetical protein